MKENTNNQLYSKLKGAADILYQKTEPAEYASYCLTLLFLKIISQRNEKRINKIESNDEPNYIKKISLKNIHITLRKKNPWKYILSLKNNDDFVQVIDNILNEIEGDNPKLLKGVFGDLKFNKNNLGQSIHERNGFFVPFMEHIDTIDTISNEDTLGRSYEFLIQKYYQDAKGLGRYYTPYCVSKLMANILNIKPGSTVLDPTCGSGSLLIEAAKIPGEKTVILNGQEISNKSYALCKMNMILHKNYNATILKGDVLEQKLFDKKFDYVIANPPFNTKTNGQFDKIRLDTRFSYEMVPSGKSSATTLFIQHMIFSLKPNGRMISVCDSGFLFKNLNKKIREKLILQKQLRAIIFLPENIFPETGVQTCLLIIDKNNKNDKVQFINASKMFIKIPKHRIIEDSHINQINALFNDFKNIKDLSVIKNIDELKSIDFKLQKNNFFPIKIEKININLNWSINDFNNELKEINKNSNELNNYFQELGIKSE